MVFPSLLRLPSTMTYEPTLMDDLLIVPELSCPPSYWVALVRTTVVTPVYSLVPDELVRGQALEARVASAGGERDRSVLRLQELLDTAGEDAHVALLHFELWRLCQGRAHAEAALVLYRHLYERAPRHLYRSRIEELAG